MKKINTFLILIAKSTKLLKVLKSAKLLKVTFSFLSMAIFAACHSAAAGIAFGISLLILLFIHEMGHVIALKKKGFGLKLPIFIPFVGAVVFAPKIKDRHDEAYVGYGGPFIGTIAALFFALPYFFTGDKFWITGSLIGVALNLFNMIPISPLDGGRITQAIHSKFKYVGFLLLLALTVALGEPGTLLIWMAVILDFDSIRMKKRLQISLGIWVLMTILTVSGVGNNFVANIADVILGSVIALSSASTLFTDRGQEREEELALLEEEMTDRRPECDWEVRKLWFVAWISLIFVQIIAIVFQVIILK